MPSRGYRKGISDQKVAAPRRIHTRLPLDVHDALVADSGARCRPASALIRAIIAAHYRQQRAELPQANAGSAVVRELCRLGNNVNQIARQANLMRLHLMAEQAAATLEEINAAARRLAR